MHVKVIKDNVNQLSRQILAKLGPKLFGYGPDLTLTE